MPDILIAATAELADLTVLHVERDLELIAEVTGVNFERLSVERRDARAIARTL